MLYMCRKIYIFFKATTTKRTRVHIFFKSQMNTEVIFYNLRNIIFIGNIYADILNDCNYPSLTLTDTKYITEQFNICSKKQQRDWLERIHVPIDKIKFEYPIQFSKYRIYADDTDRDILKKINGTYPPTNQMDNYYDIYRHCITEAQKDDILNKVYLSDVILEICGTRMSSVQLRRLFYDKIGRAHV